MEQVGLEWAAREPHPALRRLVRRYFGYTQRAVSLAVHRGLPSRSITLIISLAGPVRLVGGPGADRGPLTSQAVVGGLHLGPALIEQDRYQQGMHLELNPLSLQALLGVPASELSSDVVDLAELPVAWARTLPERLAGQPDWTGRFDVLDEVLTGALGPVTLVEEIQWAWRRMVMGNGSQPVTTMADEVGWSRRHFTERFAREVGLGPKQVSRLIRFERSAELLRRGCALADSAARAGYYDQAHMSNEWRVLAGCSPSEWIREELPFLQDGDGPGRTDSEV
jgi:AraC-like DNA-binding protein